MATYIQFQREITGNHNKCVQDMRNGVISQSQITLTFLLDLAMLYNAANLVKKGLLKSLPHLLSCSAPPTFRFDNGGLWLTGMVANLNFRPDGIVGHSGSDLLATKGHRQLQGNRMKVKRGREAERDRDRRWRQ